jgi:hypothetical protein
MISSNNTEGVAAAGYGVYSFGWDLVLTYPKSQFVWSIYTSAITGSGELDSSAARIFSQSGVEFNATPYDVAPGSISGVPARSP